MYYIVELNTLRKMVSIGKESGVSGIQVTEDHADYVHVLSALAKKASIALNDTLIKKATVSELQTAIVTLLYFSICQSMRTGDLVWTFTITDKDITITVPTDSKDSLKCILGSVDTFGIPAEYLVHQINSKWDVNYSKHAIIHRIDKNDLYWLWTLKTFPFVDIETTLFLYLMGSSVSKEGVQYDDLNMVITSGEFVRAVEAHAKRLATPTFVEKLQMIMDKDYRIKLSFMDLVGVIIIGGIFGVIISSIVFFILGKIT